MLVSSRLEFFRVEDGIQFTMTVGASNSAGVVRSVSEASVELSGGNRWPNASPNSQFQYQLALRGKTLEGYGKHVNGDSLVATLQRAGGAAKRPRVELDRSVAIQRAVEATCLVAAEE